MIIVKGDKEITIREGFKKNVKLGLLSEVRGGRVRVGFWGPTFY